MEAMEYILLAGLVLTLLLQVWLLLLFLRRPWRKDAVRIADRQTEEWKEELREQRQVTAEEFWRMEQRIDGLGERQMRLQTDLLRGQKEEQKLIYDSLTRQSARLSDTLTETVGRLQESNEKRLDQMREIVDEKLSQTLTERLDSSFRQVSEQLQSVYRSLGEMKNLAGDVNDLQRMLTNVKVRGTWGEVQLGNLLEQTLTEAQYAKNVAIKNNGERVEYAVRVPSRDQEGAWIWLPIDSKFPQEDYLRLADAAERVDKAGVEEAGRALERSIRKSAETIARLYIDVPNTTDFAILFLPTEGLYAEVLRRPGLTEEIQRKYRVMICGPATVTAFLNTLRVGFRTIALDRQASQVWKLLEATKAQYEQFGRQLEKAQKKIEEAGHAVGEAQKKELERLIKGAEFAHSLGLTVNAGHGIDYENIQLMLKVPYLHELNIGYSIICRAIFTGLKHAVQEMLSNLNAYGKNGEN